MNITIATIFKKSPLEVFVVIPVTKKENLVKLAYVNVIYYFFTAIKPTPASSYMQGKTFLTTLLAVSDQMNFDLNEMVDFCLRLHYTLGFRFPLSHMLDKQKDFTWRKN